MDNEWEDWRGFREKHDRIVRYYKGKVIVTIYGSYYPPSEKMLLKDLKDILIQDGYVNTKLVEDRQKANDAPLEISQWCMLYSNINLLIFTKRGRKYGVIDELTFLTYDRQMFDKIPFSKVFYQVKAEGNSALPALSYDRVMKYSVPASEFRSIRELKSIIARQTYWILRSWITKQGGEI